MPNPNPMPNQSSEVIYKPERAPKVRPVDKKVVKVYVWELPVRVFHWINALAIVLLMITGIYIGNPFLGATVPEEAYYSNVMGWARYIHFFSAFIFTINLVVRWYWVFKGNKYATSNPFRRVFWEETYETIKYYLFMKNKKHHYVGHNPLAQLSYWIFIGIGSLVIMFTGYYLYFEPQPESIYGKFFFSWVPLLFGGDSFSIRSLHHLVAWGFMIFMVVHIYMAFREDYLQRNGTMSSIFTGYKVEPKKAVGDDKDE
ncbi:Ni/Fe-hydrogenase, b-type cytochrome subunit [Cytobacillus spongiae]|jgi:Ni/Fe-hydrogenase 1 B-type cytochrome subunit|uniref:Ni/Fe-hydrogenase, b-type cytochrome subunit n=1 Tax=Cytobacillus spongiae TaxID=2901381 RepID=UPI001F2BF427|nr:Ni/Fe-hydrogenase, b-type cytochrome subunit [Cytobacillus spongiae]UII54516.1 Ni/Fe-hydrogenase, b-type cytochrome subunit [Cytobacillus spongiae]